MPLERPATSRRAKVWLSLALVCGVLTATCVAVHAVASQQAKAAITRATSLSELGTVMGSPAYRLSIFANNWAAVWFFAALGLLVVGLIVRARDRRAVRP